MASWRFQRHIVAIAAQPATAPNFDVPADACDCHTHIFGDPQTCPFFSGRVYTPPTALPDEMAALHRALRIRRVVIVTPSSLVDPSLYVRFLS